MATDSPTTGTAQVNGTLWGSAARDWAGVQEGQFRAGYQAVLAHCGAGDQTDYLDAGCGAGMAAQLAAALGARLGVRRRRGAARHRANGCRRAISARPIWKACPSPTPPLMW